MASSLESLWASVEAVPPVQTDILTKSSVGSYDLLRSLGEGQSSVKPLTNVDVRIWTFGHKANVAHWSRARSSARDSPSLAAMTIFDWSRVSASRLVSSCAQSSRLVDRSVAAVGLPYFWGRPRVSANRRVRQGSELPEDRRLAGNRPRGEAH